MNAIELHMECPTCLQKNVLPEHRGVLACEACGKKARRFTFFDRDRDVVLSWCEDVECRWEVADLLGMARHRLSWCSCARIRGGVSDDQRRVS